MRASIDGQFFLNSSFSLQKEKKVKHLKFFNKYTFVKAGEKQAMKTVAGLGEFERYLERRGAAARTKEEYIKVITAFIKRYNINRIHKEDMIQKILEDFLLARKSPMYRFAIKNYFDFIGLSNQYNAFVNNHKIILNKQKSRGEKVYLHLNQVKKLIRALAEPYNVIAAIQYDTATRVSSILNLKRNNVGKDIDGYSYIRIVGKGGIAKTKYISPYVANMLDNYLKTHDDENVFSVNYWQYEYQLRRIGKILFDMRVHSHAFKRSRGTDLIRRGENIMTVKDALDHSSIGTTAIYIGEAGVGSKELMKREKDIWK